MYKFAFVIILGLSCLLVWLKSWLTTRQTLKTQTPQTTKMQQMMYAAVVKQAQAVKPQAQPQAQAVKPPQTSLKTPPRAASNGLSNLKTALGYCRYNSNDPSYIKNCMNKFMYP